MAKVTKVYSDTPSVRLSFLLIVAVTVIAADLLYLNIAVSRMQKEKTTTGSNGTGIVATQCPSSCSSVIEETRNTLERKINDVASTKTSTTTIVQSGGGGGSSPKEFFVSFGSGQSSSDTWTDVAGAQASIDKGNYPSVKSVVFEASVLIPTGNETAYVRLYNVTAKHAVWNSEVSLDGGTGKLLTSKALTLDKGNNVYQVQMKTTLKYPAMLNQARLRITTK